MFTGIIQELGTVRAVQHGSDSAVITVGASKVLEGVNRGDSIQVSGVCLTVLDWDADSFRADVMGQTLALTTIGELGEGSRVNLEPAMTMSTRLGGHIVQGHVEGVGEVLSVTEKDQWRVLRISLPLELAPLVTDKGSITVDGVSLTVSAISEAAEAEQWFEISLIPETLEVTTLGLATPGTRVNLETDILARHVQRLNSFNEGKNN